MTVGGSLVVFREHQGEDAGRLFRINGIVGAEFAPFVVVVDLPEERAADPT